MEVPGFTGITITEQGEVRNAKGKVLSQNQTTKGYFRVNIPGHNTQFIHRLLALTYIPNTDNLPVVDHIDRNRQNNTISNLRWASLIDNRQNSGTNKNNKLGEKHIHWQERDKRFHIIVKQIGKPVYKRSCETLEEAILLRDAFLNDGILDKVLPLSGHHNIQKRSNCCYRVVFEKKENGKKITLYNERFKTLPEAIKARDDYLSN